MCAEIFMDSYCGLASQNVAYIVVAEFELIDGSSMLNTVIYIYI